MACFALCLWTLPRWRGVVAFGVLGAACVWFDLRPFLYRQYALNAYSRAVVEVGPLDRRIDGAPDTKVWGRYDALALREWAAGYTERGLRFYVSTQYQFDVIFPFVYGFFLALGIALPWEYARKKHSPASRPWLWLLWPPALAVGFDFAENITVVSLLNGLPADKMTPSWEWWGDAAGWFTWLKWRFCLASGAAAVVGLVWAYWPKREEPRS